MNGASAGYHTVAIPPSGEAAHVIDGLLYHEADLSISVHHTDGGGVSDHVFALAHLLGFRFAPRIPNLAERRLYGFGRSQQTTRIAQRTQLQREAELVMVTAAPADDGQIVVAEGPVPDQVGFGHG